MKELNGFQNFAKMSQPFFFKSGECVTNELFECVWPFFALKELRHAFKTETLRQI